jgi:hypothetical protein
LDALKFSKPIVSEIGQLEAKELEAALVRASCKQTVVTREKKRKKRAGPGSFFPFLSPMSYDRDKSDLMRPPFNLQGPLKSIQL